MLSCPESPVTGYDMFSAAAAGIYPAGNNPTTGIAAGLMKLGTRVVTRDGRAFRFSRNGAVLAVAGSLYQASAPIAGGLAQTPAAAAVGATAITISALTTTVTQNQYAEGWMQVDTTPGNGIMYGVNSHLAITGGQAGVFNLEKDDFIQVALTTASRVGFLANPYADIIVCPTTLTAIAVGVPLYAIPIAQYGWIQTWGPCPLLINGTPGVDARVVPSATTGGAVDVATVAAELNTRHIGKMIQVGVSTKNNAVYLMLG